MLSDPSDISNTFTYYFNYTGYNQVGDDQVGALVWNEPYTDEDGNLAYASQAMSLVYQPTSNVAAPQFGFSQSGFLIGFDSEGGLFGYNYVDDSKFVPGQFPTTTTPRPTVSRQLPSLLCPSIRDPRCPQAYLPVKIKRNLRSLIIWGFDPLRQSR